MWRWVDPGGKRSPTGYRTEAEAQSAAIKLLTGRAPAPEHVALLWKPCAKARWRLEFVT